MKSQQNPSVRKHPKVVPLRDIVLTLGKDLGLKERDLQTLSDRHLKEGDSFFTITLPKLAKALERGLADGVFKLPSCFKRRTRSQELPSFCGSLFRKVFRRDGSLLDEFDVVSVYVIRQLCYFTNKVEMPMKEEKQQRVIENFIETEKEVEAFNRIPFGEDEKKLLSIPNFIVRSLFSDFDVMDIKPKNGPGISSNSDYTKKFSKQLSVGIRNTLGQSLHYWFNPNDAHERLERYPVWRTFDYFNANLKAKVILVPKDSRGPRLISCEPVESMFIQQGIMEYMVDRLETHPLTRGQINFTDQSVNQRLAIEASKTKYWATLDLKDASDRVSLKLVTHVFGGSPIFEALLATRTPITVLPDSREISLAKFAPMGSALCFPVMALCLWTLSVTYLATKSIPIDEARQMVYVYGDDLIVPSEHAHGVSDFIERFCLRVNKEKCFIHSHFAESCGRDAVKGNDVTPIRLRKCLQAKDSTSIVSYVKSAQLLSTAGLTKTAELLYSMVECHIGKLPYGSPTAPYLCRLATRMDTLPEQNILWLPSTFWKKTGNLQRYPHGRLLRAWTTKPLEQEAHESMYARFMRTWGTIGRDFSADTLPDFGVFPRPNSITLVRGLFDHYDMS